MWEMWKCSAVIPWGYFLFRTNIGNSFTPQSLDFKQNRFRLWPRFLPLGNQQIISPQTKAARETTRPIKPRFSSSSHFFAFFAVVSLTVRRHLFVDCAQWACSTRRDLDRARNTLGKEEQRWNTTLKIRDRSLLNSYQIVSKPVPSRNMTQN